MDNRMTKGKTKILFLTIHRPDRSPSQRFRFEQYISHLNHDAFDCEHVFLLDASDDKVYYSKNNEIRKFWIVIKSVFRLLYKYFSTPKGAIFFVQRECFMLGSSFFERILSQKGKLIFDFDDSIWIHTISEANKRLAWLKRSGKTAEIIASSKIVFAGNQFLADYARKFNQNVVIIPTTIDTEEYVPNYSTNKKAVCIGWSGSFTTIEHFETCIETLKIIKDKYKDKIYFKVIGDKNYVNEALNIKGYPWEKSTELVDLQEIDIGIMPLPDDDWAKGKCGLKGLQYMALSIPTLMSPVGVNKDIIQDGVNGYLCNDTQEWVEKLSLLIEDPQLRERIGKKGRDTIENSYSVRAIKHIYLKYFKELAKV
jgi:glycosyltransferase involved in cell wall biosynthesis